MSLSQLLKKCFAFDKKIKKIECDVKFVQLYDYFGETEFMLHLAKQIGTTSLEEDVRVHH